MARTGYAKGANSGHITEERTLKAKPSSRKGVSSYENKMPVKEEGGMVWCC